MLTIVAPTNEKDCKTLENNFINIRRNIFIEKSEPA